MSFDTRSATTYQQPQHPQHLQQQQQQQRDQRDQRDGRLSPSQPRTLHQPLHDSLHQPRHTASLDPPGLLATTSPYLMASSAYTTAPVSTGIATTVAGLSPAGPSVVANSPMNMVSPLSMTGSPQLRSAYLGASPIEDHAAIMAAAHAAPARRRSERLTRGGPSPPASTVGSTAGSTPLPLTPTSDTFRPQFSTQVDILMRTIQSRADEAADKNTPAPAYQRSPVYQGMASPTGTEDGAIEPVTKPFVCNTPGCTMTFWQKTHLDIHKRSHTGEKPYLCSYTGCGAHFSQLGNLRTHERRHTGEKPFRCEKCDKYFAQRGNLKAHLKTHLRLQPYECRLDACKKRFTQLGNMKAHQNKYHATSLAALTTKFAQAAEGDEMAAASITPEDRELFQHFADLYKNSNKGIKGRGKHRRVRPVAPKLPMAGAIIDSAPAFPTAPAVLSRRSRMGRIMRSPSDGGQPGMMSMSEPMPMSSMAPTSGSEYVIYPPPLAPLPQSSTSPYGSNLGKLVHGQADHSNNAGSSYSHHHAHPPSLPPPLPPSSAMGPYGGQPAMGHGMPSHAQHIHGMPHGPPGTLPSQQHQNHNAPAARPPPTSYVAYDNYTARSGNMYDNGVY